MHQSRSGFYSHWLTPTTANAPVPRHVAFIMDGNRRWAREMGYSSVSIGHQYGAAQGEKILHWCRDAKIRHVTVYVASVDNLRKRPATEIQCLTDLIERFIKKRIEQRDAHIHVAGRLDFLPPTTAHVLQQACEASANFSTDFHLTAAIAYDGHTEILDAVRSYLREKATTHATLEHLADKLSVEDLARHLYTNGQPYPELVVRTGGDLRLSCFMPWQTAYSDLYFSRSYWPALSKRELLHALRLYAASRNPQRSTVWQSALAGSFARLLDAMRSARQNWTDRKKAPSRLPRHVALILSGDDLKTQAKSNGNGARIDEGTVNFSQLLSWCLEFQIETLTLGLLAANELRQSAGDLSRPLTGLIGVVENLSSLPVKPRLSLHGRLDLLPRTVSSQLAAAVAQTETHTGLKTNLIVGYDGRFEIVEAVRELLAEHARQGESIEELLERLKIDDIDKMLCPPGEPDLDLIIRTSSDQNMNGFQLWQSVHSEFWFCKEGATRFKRTDFMQALRDFGSRERRYGA